MPRKSNSKHLSGAFEGRPGEQSQRTSVSGHPELETAAFLASIVESSNDAIISKDLNGIITSWNRGAEHIFGYKPFEAIGRPITILIPPEHLQEENYILGRIRSGERVEHFETVRRRKDGSDVDISLTISPVRNAKGTIIGASKIARDITAQRRARDLFRQSEERFRVTLSSIGDGVIATDEQGRVTFMNAVAEKLTGWRDKDADGSPLDTVFRIINEITRQPVENPVARVIETGRVVGLGNHTTLIAKDGSEQPIDDSAAPIRRTDGSLAGVVLVFRDASEQRASEINARKLDDFVKTLKTASTARTWRVWSPTGIPPPSAFLVTARRKSWAVRFLPPSFRRTGLMKTPRYSIEFTAASGLRISKRFAGARMVPKWIFQ